MSTAEQHRANASESFNPESAGATAPAERTDEMTRATITNLFTVEGSHGTLGVRVDTGEVVSADADEYAFIKQFDMSHGFIAPEIKSGDWADILDMGYWWLDSEGRKVFEPHMFDQHHQDRA